MELRTSSIIIITLKYVCKQSLTKSIVLFKNQQEPIKKAIYEQKIAPRGQKPNFMSAEEGMKRVQSSFFAFHTELNTGYKIISNIFHENEKCSLREITFVDVIEPWMSMQKKSIYQEAMKIG